MFSRNLGLITEKDQIKLKNSTVLIAGVGGMGGVAAEVLVRLGIENIKICDPDIFEETNFNRQIHSNMETVNVKKVLALKTEFEKINPNLKIVANEDGVSLDNIDELLEGVDYVINGMDQMFNSLILERKARENSITIVDAWLTPFASVFVMKPDSPHWEEFMDLPTQGIALEDLTEEICNEAVSKEVEYTLSHFSPLDYVDPEVVQDVLSNKRPRPSLAPVVWLSGVLMANEVFKLITGESTTDHAGIFFDQYNHQLLRGNVSNESVKKAA